MTGMLELRYVVPPNTSTELPVLQYRRWMTYPDGTGAWSAWLNVPVIVAEETAP